MAHHMQMPIAAPRERPGTTTAHSIVVEWDADPTATRFQLQFALNSLSAPWKTAAVDISGGASSHNLSGLEPDTEYIVRLRAAYFREAIWGAFSPASAPVRTAAAASVAATAAATLDEEPPAVTKSHAGKKEAVESEPGADGGWAGDSHGAGEGSDGGDGGDGAEVGAGGDGRVTAGLGREDSNPTCTVADLDPDLGASPQLEVRGKRMSWSKTGVGKTLRLTANVTVGAAKAVGRAGLVPLRAGKNAVKGSVSRNFKGGGQRDAAEAADALAAVPATGALADGVPAGGAPVELGADGESVPVETEKPPPATKSAATGASAPGEPGESAEAAAAGETASGAQRVTESAAGGSRATAGADTGVLAWLRKLGFTDFASYLMSTAVGVETLEDMTFVEAADLKEAGMNKIQIRRFLSAASKLKQQPTPNKTPAPIAGDADGTGGALTDGRPADAAAVQDDGHAVDGRADGGDGADDVEDAPSSAESNTNSGRTKTLALAASRRLKQGVAGVASGPAQTRAQPPPPPPPPETDTVTTLVQRVGTLNPSFAPAVRGPSPVYKIILIGSANVGKTNMLRVFTENGFDSRSAPTLKPEFVERSVPHPDGSGRVLRLALWDTMGQERYHAVTSTHYRRADGALLLYDVADKKSFEALPRWMQELKDAAGDSLAMTMLVANKIDLLPQPPDTFRDAKHRDSFVTPGTPQALCKEHGLIMSRTTAKCDEHAHMWGGQTVYEAMMRLVKAIYEIEKAYHTRNVGGPA
eukprot:g6620.t1